MTDTVLTRKNQRVGKQLLACWANELSFDIPDGNLSIILFRIPSKMVIYFVVNKRHPLFSSALPAAEFLGSQGPAVCFREPGPLTASFLAQSHTSFWTSPLPRDGPPEGGAGCGTHPWPWGWPRGGCLGRQGAWTYCPGCPHACARAPRSSGCSSG